MTASQTTTTSLAELARSLAEAAHDGQFRRDGATPYFAHLEEVAERVHGNEEREAVAWLHDIMEDTPHTVRSLAEAGISFPVVQAVEAMTKRTDEPYFDYLERVKANPLATTVKVADMLSNLADTPTQKQLIKYAQGILFLVDDPADES